MLNGPDQGERKARRCPIAPFAVLLDALNLRPVVEAPSLRAVPVVAAVGWTLAASPDGLVRRYLKRSGPPYVTQVPLMRKATGGLRQEMSRLRRNACFGLSCCPAVGAWQ